MNLEVLREIGLTEGEIKVYIALTSIGSGTHGIITKESHVSGSKVYKILDKLIEKGLISYVYKGKIKHFSSAEAEKLNDYYQRKQKELEQKNEPLQKLIEELKLRKNLAAEKTTTAVYEGYEGFKTVYDKVLEEATSRDEILAFGVPPAPSLVQRYFLHWYKALDKKKVKSRIIYNINAKQTARERYEGIKYSKYKLISGPTTATTMVFRDQVFLHERMGETQINIVITNKEIANSHRTYFEYLWRQAEEDDKK